MWIGYALGCGVLALTVAWILVRLNDIHSEALAHRYRLDHIEKALVDLTKRHTDG